jgi:hypothetical protein
VDIKSLFNEQSDELKALLGLAKELATEYGAMMEFLRPMIGTESGRVPEVTVILAHSKTPGATIAADAQADR